MLRKVQIRDLVQRGYEGKEEEIRVASFPAASHLTCAPVSRVAEEKVAQEGIALQAGCPDGTPLEEGTAQSGWD